MTVLRAIERAVARSPTAPAVIWRGAEALTYEVLWARAGGLAARLRARGVGRTDRVALSGPKTPEHLVALLAAWRAGAAWVPVDPSLPPARRAALLRGARPAAVLRWSSGGETSIDGGGPSAPAVQQDLRAEDPAYCIFTSGSTGAPKGVLVPHGGLLGVLEAQADLLDVRPEDRVLDALSPSFDARISDIGVALVRGAAIVLAEPDWLTDPGRLLARLGEARVRYADLPPALLSRLDPAACPATLRTILVGGEVCPRPALARWAERVRLFVAYGPTEATICTSLARVDAAYPAAGIGRPLPGVGYRIEGDELWIRGPGLALGYLDDPARTAARFVMKDGLRWYRTGDRVERRPEGDYVFRGRLDRQLKLHGRLVEPGEIEARLLAHPKLAAARVIKRGAGLEAHVELNEGTAASQDDLRAWVATTLEPHKVPRAVYAWPRLPRGPAGKVDEAALAARSTPAEPAAAPSAGEDPIGEACARAVGRLAVDEDADLEALGLGSMARLELAERLEQIGVATDPCALAPPLTLRRLRNAAGLAERGRGPTAGGAYAGPADARTRAELEAEVRRRCARIDFREAAARRGAHVDATDGPGARRTALVTGATGHLGRRVVLELSRLGVEPIALVRAPSVEAAQDRLRGVLDGAGDEVRAVPGDLGAPRFGWATPRWDQIAREVDLVVHAGARVSLAEAYEALESTNVGGTAEVLAFCRAGRKKRLVHVSTLSVFAHTDRSDPVFYEADDLSATDRVHGGYAQSKWVGERLVAEATDLDRSVLRLGLVTPDVETGDHNPEDQLSRVLRALSACGLVPRIAPERALDVTPLGYAARATAHLATTGAQGALHIAGAAPIAARDLFAALRRVAPDLREVCPEALFSEAEGPDRALLRLALSGRRRAYDLFLATGRRFDCARAQSILRPAGIECPPADGVYLDGLVRAVLTAPR